MACTLCRPWRAPQGDRAFFLRALPHRLWTASVVLSNSHFGPVVLMCASAQAVGTQGAGASQIGREADQKRGYGHDQVFRSADAAEIFALEHRFPFATTLISLFLAGNVGSAILMLIAQT